MDLGGALWQALAATEDHEHLEHTSYVERKMTLVPHSGRGMHFSVPKT